MNRLLKRRILVALLLVLAVALLLSASYLGMGTSSVGARTTSTALASVAPNIQATTTTKRPAATTTTKRSTVTTKGASTTATTKRSTKTTASTLATTTTTAVPGPPGFAPLHAPAAIVIDMKTGAVMYSRKPDQKRAMASTTKMMTAILAIENLPLDKVITISAHAGATGEQSVQLKAGEKLTVEQLLFATLVWSANDAAVALAEAVSGSESAFVKQMNEKAVELGLENTHYANAHGLDAQNHHTSARDLALLAIYCMKNAEFRKLAGTVHYSLQIPGREKAFDCRNVNKLVGFVREATGVKTGFTNDAMFCLVASVDSGGREMMSVVMGERNWSEVYADTLVLLLYGLSRPSN
jgi:D-alanyl-D-alanine carboxypeptidase